MVTAQMDRATFDAKAKQLATEQGINLAGDKGQVSKSGVTVGYSYDGQTLTLNVLKKPFIVSTAYCETQMRGWLGVS
jgi:hypothetical protein